jgi:hypothetical protein
VVRRSNVSGLPKGSFGGERGLDVSGASIDVPQRGQERMVDCMQACGSGGEVALFSTNTLF